MQLISFLGASDYREARYHWNGKCFESKYIAEALAHLAKIKSVVILATEKAESVHGGSLSQTLAEANIACRIERISEGRSREELWKNFTHLSELLNTDTPTIIDITHGFRSQPFFAGAVVSFVRALRKSAPQMKIVYGAFDARDEAGNTPIWDLTPFVELLDFTHAIDIFLASGKGDDLADKAKALGSSLAKEWAQLKKGRQPKIHHFARALQDFSEALTAVRTGKLLLKNGKQPSAAECMLAAVQEAEEDLKIHLPPVSEVLDKISEMLEPLTPAPEHLAGDQGKRLMANLARLYFKLGRYAETGITLREGWVNLYASPAATCPGQNFDPKERRNAERRMTEAGQEVRELAGIRNDLEHGGFRKDPKPPKTIKTQLEKFIAQFEQAHPQSLQLTRKHTTWFVSRHPGAIEWAKRQGLSVDQLVSHLDVEKVGSGDTVIGTLPVHLAAAVCCKGARYLHLALEVPAEARGRELSADELEAFGARIEAYRIEREEP